ncbi:MAG: type II secretion system protein [bacterium]
MENGKSNKKPRRGFTILELLVVISIMAVLATLSIGAATRAIKRVRNNRIDSTCKALEMALMNYRAQENKWPVTMKPSGNDSKVVYQDKENKEVFKPLYKTSGSSRTSYLDASAVLADYQGHITPLQKVLSKGITDVPLAYPDPEKTSRICYFRVEFNLLTDSVKVSR